MPSRKPEPHTVTAPGGGEITIWGDAAILPTFFPGISPDGDSGPVNISAAMPGTSRRRYPGDANPYSRGAYTAVSSRGGDARKSTTPGKAFTCETSTGTYPNVVTTTRQFTLVGSVADLIAYARSVAGGAYTLRTPNGVPKAIVDATP